MLERIPNPLLYTLLILGVGILRISGPLGNHAYFNLFGFILSFGSMLLLWKQTKPLSLKAVILLGLFSRFLFVGYPVSDDFNRYAWEGMIQTYGFNPYVYAPNAPELKELQSVDYDNWKKINHPEMQTIYPPIPLLVMKLLSPYYPSPEPFRLLIILFELFTILILIGLLKHFKKPLNNLTLYALNPFIIVFLAGEAHLDALQVTFVMAALYFYSRDKFRWSFLSLGHAVFTKVLGLLYIPTLIHKKNLWTLPFLLLPIFYITPFLGDNANFFTSLSTFSTDMTFNAPISFLLKKYFGEFALFVIGFIFIALSGLHLLTEHRPLYNMYFISVLFLCLAPTVHPWYLTLALPFLPLCPRPSLLLLTVTMFIFLLPQYAINFHTGVWAELTWSKWVIWVPFFATLWWELWWSNRKEPEKPLNPDQTLNSKSNDALNNIGFSIIIPTFNEAEKITEVIRRTQSSLKTLNLSHEIIVVDGGSEDNTETLAKKAGAQFHLSPQRGRGVQLEFGLRQAKLSHTLFLHADTKLDDIGFQKLYQTLQANPERIGGWHTMAFGSAPPLKLKAIQFLNNFRARYLKIAFGDQLQFVHTESARRHKLLQPLPLMEDVDLSINIKKHGEPLVQNHAVTVSSRKWDRSSFTGNTLLIIWLVIRFLVQKRLGFLSPTDPYYINRYYKPPVASGR